MKKMITAMMALSLATLLFAGCGAPAGSAPAGEAPAEAPAAEAPAAEAPAEEAQAEEAAPEGDLLKAAYITQSLANESQAYAYTQLKQYGPEYGFTVDVFEGQNDVQNEVRAIGNCIAQGYTAIFVNPSDINAIVPAIMEAKQAGLIVGMFSSDLAPEAQQYRDFFCGVDDTMAGETAAQAIMEAFPDGAKVVEVGGQAGHDAQIKRHDGFMKVIEGTNIELLDSQNTQGWVTAEAMSITEDFITKYGEEIDAVFCHWDNGATGVIEALGNKGMTEVFVAGVDGNRAGYDQVKAGVQGVSVGQSFTNMAIKSLENARAMLDGQSFEVINFIPLDKVTIDTVDTLPYPEW